VLRINYNFVYLQTGVSYVSGAIVPSPTMGIVGESALNVKPKAGRCPCRDTGNIF